MSKLVPLVNFAFPRSIVVGGKQFYPDGVGVYQVPENLEPVFKQHGFVSAHNYLAERERALGMLNQAAAGIAANDETATADPVEASAETAATADPVEASADTTA